MADGMPRTPTPAAPFGSLPCRLRAHEQVWPLRRAFTIARGSRTEVHTIIVGLTDADGRTGRGEAVPYPRHGETPRQVLADINQALEEIEAGVNAQELPRLLRTLAARTAVDCALWDLAAREQGRPAWQLAGLPRPEPRITACTISLDAPDRMAEEAAERSGYPLLKLKLGGAAADDMARLAAVRAARPDADLIVDANEGWQAEDLPALLHACAQAGVSLVEQPLPAGEDNALADIERPVPVCADESLRGPEDLRDIASRYDAVNVKLDKAGGLTPALALARQARQAGLRVMVGCMLASSLAMAPAFLLAPLAEWIDLDGPLLLAADAEPPFRFDGALMHPADAALWGG